MSNEKPLVGRKRGRKPEHYRASWGDRINGLARRPSDGRWRVIGTDVTYSEPDERLAIHKYLTHYAPKAKSATVGFLVPSPARNHVTEDLPVLRSFDYSASGQCQATQHLSESAIWSWLREQVLSRPHYVAQMTGIEQIGYLSEIQKPTPSPTLEQVGNLYLGNTNVSEGWRSKCKLFWQEFRDAVDDCTLRELTQERLIQYADMIQGAASTPTHARQRFGAIKTIINYPTKRGKWAEDAKRALALCSVLTPPKKSMVDPKPIRRDAFHTLLRAADVQMKAMLLLALNCCMYGGEVAALGWADVDLPKRTLCTVRCKTGIVRIAVLWNRTIQALRKLPRAGEVIFITSGTKMQHNYQTLYQSFHELRGKVELADVQFAQLRDGAYTAAVEAGIPLDTCRLLAGHATGISDHYVKRRPQMVAEACAAIEKAYFS